MTLEQTLKDSRLFILFSTALMMMTKSNRVLKLGGATPEAIAHITTGIELISRQLDEAAVKLETEMHAVKEAEELLNKLGVPHGKANSVGPGD